VVGRD